ncbi:MAG: aspartate-semialdehyde dehydrogenase [Nitrososphaerales archaeon]
MRSVAIVGATGVVGQQFVVALQKHPWFKIAKLAASQRSAGKTYEEALRRENGALAWFCDEEPDPEVLRMKVEDAATLNVDDCDLVFTALESDQALLLEPKYAKKKPVISTASAFRYEPDVPIIVPGVNNEHVELLSRQKESRGWNGFITPIPNCTTTGLVITLKPIYDRFGINRVLMTSMQAISGAGRSPGVLALDILDNVIPYIPKEEEKVQTETLKILGKLGSKGIEIAPFKVSCTCTRVNVKDGHTESVFVSAKKTLTVEAVKEAMSDAGKELKELGLPSAPTRMIYVLDDPFRPQPRLDRNREDGMATTVGRIRLDDALENGVKYVLVSHNTKMGAAKGAVLVGELLEVKGFLT